MKKWLKAIGVLIGIIVVFGILFFTIDYNRVKNNETPIFCILKDEANDGGTKIYLGIGYKVIDFHTLAGYDDIKIGTWLMNYDDFEEEIKKYEENDNMKATLKAVVVKVNDNNFFAMGIENGADLYSIGLDNIELKKGQEILIHFNGDIMETYPAQLGNVGRIEIVKDKSDTPISDDILRFCYNSKDNVTVTISELSKNSITLTIKDKNELSYNYSNSYKINKKVKNENYTGVGEPIGENTNNSTAGYTRNWNRIYLERSR